MPEWEDVSVDPLFEKNIDASPYSYCYGNPVVMVDPDGRDEIYYREDGTEILRITCKEDVKYVLRTQETTDQMYRECSPTEKGKSNHIHPGDADIAENLIKDICTRKFGYKFKKEDIQEKYFVKAPNQEEFDAGFAVIKDDGTGGTKPENNKEYAWNINHYDYSVYSDIKSESSGDPSLNSDIGVEPRQNHTHPSGTNGRYKWQQPPSKTDIENHKYSSPKYVWGMRSQKLYIYNNSGVIAVVPFSIYKK